MGADGSGTETLKQWMFLYFTEDTQSEGKYCAAGWVVVLGASEISEKSERK